MSMINKTASYCSPQLRAGATGQTHVNYKICQQIKIGTIISHLEHNLGDNLTKQQEKTQSSYIITTQLLMYSDTFDRQLEFDKLVKMPN